MPAPAVLLADVQVGHLGARFEVADGGPYLDAGKAHHLPRKLGKQRHFSAGAGCDALGQPVGAPRWTAECTLQRRHARCVGRRGLVDSQRPIRAGHEVVITTNHRC